MSDATINLPYFDLIFNALEQDDSAIETAFGRHVHWGYWPDPSQATHSPENFRDAAERLTQEVYQAAMVGEGQAVLDAGCGFGGTIASLNENLTGMSLTGLNIDSRQLDRAKQKVPPRSRNQILWVEGDACQLPFPDASFDRVLAVECIFHFPDRRQFFQEALRVLKPGGYLALSDFVPQAWFVPVIELNEAISGSGFYGAANVKFSLEAYQEMAAEVGFQPHLERDITTQTLPTYDFLFKTGSRNGIDWSQWPAFSQTLAIAAVSHLQVVKYMILAYQKPERRMKDE